MTRMDMLKNVLLTTPQAPGEPDPGHLNSSGIRLERHIPSSAGETNRWCHESPSSQPPGTVCSPLCPQYQFLHPFLQESARSPAGCNPRHGRGLSSSIDLLSLGRNGWPETGRHAPVLVDRPSSEQSVRRTPGSLHPLPSAPNTLPIERSLNHRIPRRLPSDRSCDYSSCQSGHPCQPNTGHIPDCHSCRPSAKESVRFRSTRCSHWSRIHRRWNTPEGDSRLRVLEIA